MIDITVLSIVLLVFLVIIMVMVRYYVMWVVDSEIKKQNELLKKCEKKNLRRTSQMIGDTFNQYFGNDNRVDRMDRMDRRNRGGYDDESGDSIRDPNDE